MRASGISTGFPVLSRSSGQVPHVLLTRSPLGHPGKPGASLDLHVLSTPPAFVLSQDQTLHRDLESQATLDRLESRLRGLLTPSACSGTEHVVVRVQCIDNCDLVPRDAAARTGF